MRVFADNVRQFSDLPVFVVNDATAACRAETLYARGIGTASNPIFSQFLLHTNSGLIVPDSWTASYRIKPRLCDWKHRHATIRS